MAILLPGGAGFIGSHTAVELLNEGKEIIILDNFSNSKPEVLDAIKKITGKDFKFYEMDYLDREKLEKVFEENKIDAVLNFAGYKAVGESVQKPIEYYQNNISGALVLLDTMRKYGCKKFIFSSSATVYGEPERIPLTEDCKTGGTTNPYGTTKIIILDNFSNSKPEVLDAIKKITGKDFKFYEMDYLDREKLEKVFEENKIDAVLNFAGYKAVGESVQKPIEYYQNNISGALVLLDTMRKYGCKKFIFSSSATVYGEPERIPLTEDCKTGGTTNPYGTTKLFIEQILKDIYVSDNTWDICILRYFNPVGAHESGLIGEEPQGIPNNLMPYIVRVASGQLKELSVFGNNYDTPDGTGVRDYIHVVDLAKGHVKALEKLDKEQQGLYIYNLGTGTGYSVLDMVKAFEKATGKKVPYKIAPRRAGDIATCYAEPTKAKEELNWQAEKTLEEMCKDSWNYINKCKN